MKLAVSNLAWKPNERLEAYKILAHHNIHGLEMAPGLFLSEASDCFEPTTTELKLAVDEIEDYGLKLVSMQSLLFGVQGAALFAGPDSLGRFVAGMKRAIVLAGRLSIPNMVFGSPKQRVIPDDMTTEKATEHAATVFRELGEHARAAGTTLLMEFNPPDYGTNFLNTFRQALDFVKVVNHDALKLVLDIGAMHMNDDFLSIRSAVEEGRHFISHVHMSEPHLVPAPAREDDAVKIFSALSACEYPHWVSIEMLRPKVGALDTLNHCSNKLVNAHNFAKNRKQGM